MGKKGKKKGKETGAADVRRFRTTREYWLLKECVTIQESLPFVAMDVLDDAAFKKVARFLNMAGLLAEYLNVEMKRECRFNYHHRYLAPRPQFFPFGFDLAVIKAAREIKDNPSITYNGQTQHFPQELANLAEQFLKKIDGYMTKIASRIENRLRDDFGSQGNTSQLKKFKQELKEELEGFDKKWMVFETEYVKANHDILSKVFHPVDRIITLELLLTQAEERAEPEPKQRYENQFVQAVEAFTNMLFPETKDDPFPEDVIPLAEACIFYETKCTDAWLHAAKHLIKDFLELRFYVSQIPEERLSPHYKENAQFCRLLRAFHASVCDARESLDFVSRLPKLIHAKTENWMTKQLLEPDLRYIQRTAHLANEAGFLPP